MEYYFFRATIHCNIDGGVHWNVRNTLVNQQLSHKEKETWFKYNWKQVACVCKLKNASNITHKNSSELPHGPVFVDIVKPTFIREASYFALHLHACSN